MKKLILAILLVFLMALPAFGAEKTISFGWNQVIPNDFAGWKLYASQSPNVEIISDNLVATIAYGGEIQEEYTSNQIISVADGEKITYYFVLTAFDIDGNESVPSNEVSEIFDFEPPGQPFSLIIKVIAK